MTQKVAEFDLVVRRIDGYEFKVLFDKEQYHELLLDEPAPLGQDAHPNAARVLAAAIGNCLSASLVFCLSRSGVALEDVETFVHVELVRNENRRLRVGHVAVKLVPTLPGPVETYAKCLETFEDFCVVTQSVRDGLDVRVQVEPKTA
jgi:organic hydroperoxide reductase OsmC/OhrA